MTTTHKESTEVEEEFSRCWNYPAWLHSYPLTVHTFYDYFQNSDFFDDQCNNNQLAMRGQSITRLPELKGIEYEIEQKYVNSDNEYLLLYKYLRQSPTERRLQRTYYCPGHRLHPEWGSIFAMPNINMVFMNKLRTSVYHMNEAIHALQSQTTHHVLHGQQWKQNTKQVNVNIEDDSDNNENENEENDARNDKRAKQNEYSSMVDELIKDFDV